MSDRRVELLWKALAMVGGAVAAAGATRLVAVVWTKVTQAEPPLEDAPGSTTRRREIVWVIASGVAVAFFRLVARRGLARLWRARTGRYPQPLVESPPAPGPVAPLTT